MTDAKLPIILLGCPRSGTTLLRRLINAHPDIHCAGETFVLRAAVRFLSGEKVAEGIDYGPLGGLGAMGVAPDALKGKLRDFIMGFHRDIATEAGKSRVAIKTAIDGFYIPEIIDLMRGHAQFVALVRDGLDVTVSLKEFTDVMEGPIAELRPFLDRNGRFYPAYAAAWAKVTGDIVAAAEAYPDDVLALRYEDILDAPADTLGAMFDFLGEECDVEALVERCFASGEVQGLGDYKTFATRALDKSSVGKGRQLPERIQAEIAPLVNPLLETLGYEPVTAVASDADAMRLHELAMMYQSGKGPS